MAKIGKRLVAANKNVDSEKFYNLADAVSILKKNSTAKFDETIDIAINLGVDPKHADQMVRGMVSLPAGTGKTVKVAVFAKGAKAEEAQKAGADLVGDDELMDKIKSGDISFDRCIATPDMMAKLAAAVGKILGPKGLMPNPKLGTVTLNVAEAVKNAKSGQVEFKVDKTGIVHAGVAKASFSEQNILANVQAFLVAINRAKPSGAKGIYVQSIALSSTMSPSVKVDIVDAMSALSRTAA